MSDIYATPEAELERETTGQRSGGNIDDAIAGNIPLRIFATMGEAWRQLKGFKLKCILAGIIMFAIVVGVVVVVTAVTTALFAIGSTGATVAGIAVEVIFQLVFAAALMPLMVGVMIMGIKHLTQNEVSVGEIFRHYGKTMAVILAYILQSILIMIFPIIIIAAAFMLSLPEEIIGIAVFISVIPAFYLSIAYVYAIPLIIEKRMGVWEALETSRKSITRVWFRMFGFMLLAMLIITIGMLPVFIPLIWLGPWIVLSNALIYYTLYGVEAETVNN